MVRARTATCGDCGEKVREAIDNEPVEGQGASLGFWCSECGEYKDEPDVENARFY